jgi:hypothetical protein
VGFWTVESVEPSLSKSQAHEVGEPEEASVKVTVESTQVEVGSAEKSATGGAPTVMVTLASSEPQELVTVRV